MSLYFVHRQHDAATYPAQDTAAGNLLLEHISPINALKYGVKLKSDAVFDGQHTFVLILEADQQAKIDKFMEPFKQAGSVEIHPASLCETVIERAGC